MRLCHALLFTLLVLATPLTGTAQVETVYHGAQIYTVDPARPRAEALAVGGGRIVAVGSDAELLAAYPEARRVNLAGRTVIPGLIDAHAHVMGQGEKMLRADLVGTRSKEEVVERLRAFAEKLPPGAWLRGRGWDQNDWPEKSFPTRHDLDAAFPDRPVWLERIDGHASWANTAALRAAGLAGAAAPTDPPGGRILREADGHPAGVFIDAATALVDRAVPAPTDAERSEALRLALGEMARYGLTGVHDAGATLEEIRLFQQAIDEGWFTARLYGMIGGEGPALDHFCDAGPLLGYGGRLWVRSLKLYIDGALGSRGAALLTPYADDPENHGLLLLEPGAFERVVDRAISCGLQVSTHAIGDRGNRIVLDGYERAIRRSGTQGGRHRVEHVQVLAPEELPRFAALGVIASVQPTHATSDMYWAEERLGPERLRGAYAWRSLLDSGARLAFGSDFPVEQVNPLLGFYAAVTRRDAQGRPEDGWFPAERVTREEALHAFTLGAAYAAFMEEEVGSLTPGKWADFVVLSGDLMTVPAEKLLELKVVATFLGGRRVYESPLARAD